jgi:hypothetical protein
MNLQACEQTSWLTEKRIGVALLLGSVAINLAQLYWGGLPDEGDNIATGLLIAKGYVLYKDVFSHHFPLPYHWVAIIIPLLGTSILAIRGSLLLFQTFTFWLTQRYTGFYLPIGIATFTWSLIGSVYFHTLFLYQNIKSISLFFVVLLTFAVTGRYITLRTHHAFVIGVFSALAILSDPLSIYVIGAAMLALLINTRSLKKMVLILLPLVFAFFTYLFYFQATNSLMAFWEDVINFNSYTYSKYIRVDQLPIETFLRAASKGLHIVDARWLEFNPMRPFDKYSILPDRWFFTGFLYRASVLSLVICLLYRRKYGVALFLYLVCAMFMAARSEELMHANPFILVALFSGSFFITTPLTEAKWQFAVPRRGSQHVRSKLSTKSVMSAILASGALVMVALYGWLMLRGTLYILDNRDRLACSDNFTHYHIMSDEIHALACNDPDVRLGYYPAEPLIYFFSDMRPVSRYLFLWPWVAEKGIGEIITDLKSGDAIVHVNQDAEIWGYKARDYLAPLVQYLEQHYQKTKTDFYVSPALYMRCQP